MLEIYWRRKKQKTNMEIKRKTIVSREKALEFAVHFGHQPRRWNPAMKPFIHSTKNGTHIINVNKTLPTLEFAYRQIQKIAEKDGTFLFVGTTNAAKETAKENAVRTGSYYVNHRWLGGTLTNFKTIKNSVRKLRTLERLSKDNYAGYTKKEGVQMERELTKLERQLGGIKFMRRTPSAIIVSSIPAEMIAIKEAKKRGIPVFAISDTNADPSAVNFPIPANDDSLKSVGLIFTVLADAIAIAKGEQPKAAYVADENVKVLGVIESFLDSKDFLSRNTRTLMARDKSSKVEKKEEIKTQEKRREHNEKVEAKLEEQAEKVIAKATFDDKTVDLSKMKVTELKEFLRSKDVKFKAGSKKAELLELAEANK